MKNYFLVPLLLGYALALPLAAAAEDSDKARSAVSVFRTTGGSIQTDLGSGIVIGKGSSLTREFLAVRHVNFPIILKGAPGVRTIYEPQTSISLAGLKYKAKVLVSAYEPAAAIEVRFITFDIWGEKQRVLVMTIVRDLPVGDSELSAAWDLFSEHEARTYYASIAYIAKVRLSDGRVLSTDIEPVLNQARKFSARFTSADLEKDEPRIRLDR